MKNLIKAIVAFLILTSTSASAETITNTIIEAEFGEYATDLQLDLAWESIEGKHAVVTGKVYDVTAPNWLAKDYRVIMTLPNSILIFCSIPEAQVSRVAKVKINDTFSCEGKLEEFSLTFSKSLTIASDINVSSDDITSSQELSSAIALLESNGYSVTKNQ